MAERTLPTTDEAVKKATGKTWDQWLDFLDKEGARKLEHKEIVELLRSKKVLSNGWWCQTVTVAYERVRKGREKGQTNGVGYEIGVTKTVAVSPREAWRFLTTLRGLSLWLGKGARISFKPKRAYATADGIVGEVRTVKNGERVRLTWRPVDRELPTTLQITLTSRQQSSIGTSIAFHQEKLANAKERDKMKRYWQRALDNIAKELEKEQKKEKNSARTTSSRKK